MIKEFKYSNATIKVATNMMKSGIVYFGEKDIQGEFENIYKEINYGKSKETTTETILMDIMNKFKARGIAIKEVSIKGLSYRGAKMTDLDKQATLEEEPKKVEKSEVKKLYKNGKTPDVESLKEAKKKDEVKTVEWGSKMGIGFGQCHYCRKDKEFVGKPPYVTIGKNSYLICYDCIKTLF